MAVASGSAPPPHVPAWKRLGLKLKYAKDTAEPPPTLQQANISDGKDREQAQTSTAIPLHQLENERPSKRRRLSSNLDRTTETDTKAVAPASSFEQISIQHETPLNAENTAAKASIETESAPVPIHSHQSSSVDKRSKTVNRRKSVTFTGETKQNDGNSTQASSESAANSNPAKTEIPTSKAITGAPPSEDPKPKKAKRPKDNQSIQKGKGNSKSNKSKLPAKDSLAGAPEYVRYLEQFHQDQTSWKFNKNHQTALLNNLFSTRIVPASLTPAIGNYIEGLKGAGPRQRLTENATAILKRFAGRDGSLDEIDTMNTESARRAAYFDAMHREIDKWEQAGMPRSEYDDNELADMEEEMRQGKRAEAVLRALAKSEPEVYPAASSAQTLSSASGQIASIAGRDRPTTATIPTSTTQPKTSRKKRKKRTDVSSDSSSSDSSSDSDSDTVPPTSTNGPKTVTEALQPAPVSKPKTQSPPSRTPAYQHGDPNVSYRPQTPSQLMNSSAKPTKIKFFDDDLLDQAFPTTKTYNESAPKRKKDDGRDVKREKKARRGYAYRHGNMQDESGSESE